MYHRTQNLIGGHAYCALEYGTTLMNIYGAAFLRDVLRLATLLAD